MRCYRAEMLLFTTTSTTSALCTHYFYTPHGPSTMAPSRSRKRNSTIQALDILNNVGNANQNSLRSRVQRPSRGQLQPEVQIPQSDDIWDIPNSPEKRPDTRQRVADSEPITPRRSARYRPQLEEPKEDNASSGKGLRSRTSVNYKEGIQEGEDGKDKEGSEEEDEEGSNKDSEEDEEGDLRLFSEDDTPKTTRSSRPSSRKEADKEEFPDLPSPSALFRGDGFVVSPSASTSEQDSDASESQDSDPGEEGPNAPENTQKPDTNKTQDEEESGSNEEESSDEESSESGDESSSREASKSPPSQPRPIVQINLAQGTSQGLSSPQSARQRGSRNDPATRKTNETPKQQQAYNDSNQEKDTLVDSNVQEDSGSSYETEDGESDSSSSSEESTRLSPHEDDFPAPRRSKRRRVEPEPHSRRQSLRNQKAAPSLGGQEVEHTRDHSPQSDSGEDDDNDEEEDEEDEASKEAEKAKEEENARKLQWMEQAMSLGQQRNNWLVVNSKAKELKRMADSSLAKHFVDVCTPIRELRENYADMLDTPPSHADLVQCDNLLANIPREGNGLLDQAYHMATQDSNYSDEEEHARDLVDEFEARVLPDMVKLVFACFQVYYTNPKTFPGLHGHFRRVLILIRRFCNRTTSMKVQRIVRGVVRTNGLDRALHGLLKGLDSQALRPKRASARIAGVGNQRENIEFVNGHEREWSQDEGLALIDGLQAHQGKCWVRDDTCTVY